MSGKVPDDIPTLWDDPEEDRRLLDELQQERTRLEKAVLEARMKGDPQEAELQKQLRDVDEQIAALGLLGRLFN